MLETLLDGTVLTVQIWVLSAILAIVVAPIAGLARTSRFAPVRLLAGLFVEFFRGSSAIVQLYFAFFALPLIGVTLSPMMAGVLVLGCNVGSYGSEVVRGALAGIPRGQWEAADALGLSKLERMRTVIFPQALVAMLPPGGNLLIDLLKGTSLVSLVALSDLTFKAQQLRAGGGNTLEIFAVTLLIYFLLSSVIDLLVKFCERFLRRRLHLQVVGHTSMPRKARNQRVKVGANP